MTDERDTSPERRRVKAALDIALALGKREPLLTKTYNPHRHWQSRAVLLAQECSRLKAEHGRRFAVEHAKVLYLESAAAPAEEALRLAQQAKERAEAQVRELHEVLSDLADLQNGPPLIKDEAEWNAIMARVWPLLAATAPCGPLPAGRVPHRPPS